MVKGFKSIAVPANAKLVVSSEPDAMPEVVIAPETVTETDTETGQTIDAPATSHYPELSEKFLLAGRAVFTVSNPKGDHFTFKVRKVESEWPKFSGKQTTTFFVNAKVAGTEHPYGYIGILDITKGTIKCTAKSEFLPGTKEYDIAAWACQAVINE